MKNIIKKQTQHITFIDVKTICQIIIFLFVTHIAPHTSAQEEMNKMTSNLTYFSNTKQFIDEFTHNIVKNDQHFLLQKAVNELNKVNLDAVKNRQEFKNERNEWLKLNLEIITIIDQYYKPNTPIPEFSMAVYPSGIDGLASSAPINPKEIKDPQKRAEYEQAIAENEQNTKEAQLQILLKRLTGNDPNLDPKASYLEELKKKIPVYYTEYAEDKAEYKKLIDQSSLNSERKEEFYQLLQ